MCTMGYREADAAHPLPAPPHHTYEEMTDLPLSLSLSHTQTQTFLGSPRMCFCQLSNSLSNKPQVKLRCFPYWEKTLKCATLLIFGWRMPLSPVFSYICVSCDIFNFTIFNAQYNMGCCYYCMLYVCSSCKCKAPARLPVILIHAQ